MFQSMMYFKRIFIRIGNFQRQTNEVVPTFLALVIEMKLEVKNLIDYNIEGSLTQTHENRYDNLSNEY